MGLAYVPRTVVIVTHHHPPVLTLPSHTKSQTPLQLLDADQILARHWTGELSWL
jgi:hypothetical protein